MSRSTSRAHGRVSKLFQFRKIVAGERRLSVELPERAEVLARPRRSRIDLHIIDARLAKAVMTHGHRQPLRPVWRLDAIAIPPPVLVVLNVIVIDKHVGAPHLIEEAQPRQVARLQHDERCQTATAGIVGLMRNQMT
jgi:hypothetical protein